MSGLFQSLSLATASLTAQRLGLDVVGQNMANVNTVGYSRRTLLLAEMPPTDRLSAGRGVEVVGVRGLRDLLVEARIRREQQGTAFEEGVVQSLTHVESAIGLPGAALDERLTAFFDSFVQLADDVTSTTARDDVTRQAALLVRAFGDLSSRLVQAQSDIDQSLRDSVSEVNQLTAEIASINSHLVEGNPEVESLRDRQLVAAGRLAELADISVLSRSDGGMDVTVAGGRALVLGVSSYDITVPPSGPVSLTLGTADITGSVTGGRIGGLLHTRDTLIAGYRSRLDQIAFDFATEVNARHSAGFDATGAAAGNFFTPLASVTDAASLLAVDPAVLADSQLVAGSATGAAGDNQVARAIAALRTDRVIAGGTASALEAWGGFVQSVGVDVAASRDAGATHDQILLQLQRLRDQTSGISLDEEAANLMKYQRAYEANARYFTSIVDTLETLMDMVR